jgi:hypothetical protein
MQAINCLTNPGKIFIIKLAGAIKLSQAGRRVLWQESFLKMELSDDDNH